MSQPSIKVRRTLVGTKYSANGYGRGINKRNVYLIDGRFYAYHPAYAEQQFTPLEGEFKGYIPVNQLPQSGTFYAISSTDPHDLQTTSKRMRTKLIGRDLQFRFLGRKAVKLGLVKWYNFRIGPKNPAMCEDLEYWKDDITDYILSKK